MYSTQAYMPSFRPADGFRIVDKPQALAQLASMDSGGVVWLNTLDTLGRNVPDRRGIFHWDPSRGRNGLLRAIDSCWDALCLNALPYADETRRGMLNFLLPYYQREQSSLGVVFFESCRDILQKRFVGTEAKVKISQRADTSDVPRCQRVSYDLARDSTIRLWGKASAKQESIQPRGLRFATPSNRPIHDCVFSKTRFWRDVDGGDGVYYTRPYDVWCLSTPEVDYELLLRGRYPTQASRLIGGSINPSRLITWLAIDPVTGMTGNYCFDIDAVSGELLTLRWTSQELTMLAETDPRFDRWLYNARYGNDYVVHG